MSNKQKRLNAIKTKFIYGIKKCDHCKKVITKQEIWTVYRYAVNGEIKKYHYCKKCFKTKEDVLNEIDTDEILFGIAYVDDYIGFEKKDYTRLHEAKK